eukprot:Em0032g11a
MPEDFTPASGAPIARTPTKTASARTIKRRCMQMQNIREVVSQEESSALLRRELDYLSTSDRQILLARGWWLKASGVSISCEEKMRQIGRGLLGENLQGEVAPLSFCLSSRWGGDTRKRHLFHARSQPKVIQMLDDNHSALDRYRDQVKQLQGMKWRMYGLSGATGKYPCLICEIPQKQMAVPLSLRKRYPLRSLECIKESHKQFMAAGGKRKKVKNYMNCVTEPIFDIPIDQVCLPGLHITQGIFVKI